MQAGFRRALRIPPFLPNGGERRTNRVKGMGVGIVTGVPEALLNGRLGKCRERRCLAWFFARPRRKMSITSRPRVVQLFSSETHQRKIFIQQKLQQYPRSLPRNFLRSDASVLPYAASRILYLPAAVKLPNIAGIGAVRFLPVNPVNSLSRKMKAEMVPWLL